MSDKNTEEKKNLTIGTGINLKEDLKNSLSKFINMPGINKAKLGAAITQNLGADIAKIGHKNDLPKADLNSLKIGWDRKSPVAPTVETTEEPASETVETTKTETTESTSSDERLKRIFGENEDIIKCFGRINAIDFEYNDKAKELYGDSHGVDDKEHIGVRAQELKSNPLTEATVKTDEETGFLNVDTRQLCLTNTAVLGEVCRRLDALESIIKFMKG